MNGYKEFREVILAILVGALMAIATRRMVAEQLAPLFFGIAGAVVYTVAAAILQLIEDVLLNRSEADE